MLCYALLCCVLFRNRCFVWSSKVLMLLDDYASDEQLG